MELEEFKLRLAKLCAQESTLTLATQHGGEPWATDVYFANLGFDFYFYSSPDSRHCRNLAASPLCAAALRARAASWKEILGAQMRGLVEPVERASEKAQGLAAYLMKFPFAKELLSGPGQVAKSFSKARLHRFRPDYIRYLDNSLGLGARFALSLSYGPDGPEFGEVRLDKD